MGPFSHALINKKLGVSVAAALLVDAPYAASLLTPKDSRAQQRLLYLAEQVHGAHEVEVLQFAQAGGDVGAGDVEGGRDLFRVHRPAGEEQQRMDLRHRAIDAPARAHLAPVQDEAAAGRRQRIVGGHRRGSDGLARKIVSS